MTEVLLICHLHPARRKARAAATAEALCLLHDLGATAPGGGPLAERGGLFWIALPLDRLEQATARLPRLGYARAVDLLEPAPAFAARQPLRGRGNEPADIVRWRGRPFRLARLWTEDAGALRERAPDRRVFALEQADGAVRAIRGYRGDGGPLGRRGLPVCDARLLVNLVSGAPAGPLLDPFAGIGGILLEAVASGRRVVSCDIDPALRHGLAATGVRHCVADAGRLPFATASIAAIATEPPYDRGAERAILAALAEGARVLLPDGRLAILCAAWQAEGLRRAATALGLTPVLDAALDRKGLEVVVLAWKNV